MVMRGANVRDVQDILGPDHKMTQRYAHLSPAHLRRAVEALDGFLPTLSAHAQHMNAVQSDSALLASRKSASLKDAPVAQVDRAAVS